MGVIISAKSNIIAGQPVNLGNCPPPNEICNFQSVFPFGSPSKKAWKMAPYVKMDVSCSWGTSCGVGFEAKPKGHRTPALGDFHDFVASNHADIPIKDIQKAHPKRYPRQNVKVIPLPPVKKQKQNKDGNQVIPHPPQKNKQTKKATERKMCFPQPVSSASPSHERRNTWMPLFRMAFSGRGERSRATSSRASTMRDCVLGGSGAWWPLAWDLVEGKWRTAPAHLPPFA